jgi:hypothetical protein
VKQARQQTDNSALLMSRCQQPRQPSSCGHIAAAKDLQPLLDRANGDCLRAYFLPEDKQSTSYTTRSRRQDTARNGRKWMPRCECSKFNRLAGHCIRLTAVSNSHLERSPSSSSAYVGSWPRTDLLPKRLDDAQIRCHSQLLVIPSCS